MNNPFDYIPSPLCDEAFHSLTARIEALKSGGRQEDVNLCNELEAGKMLGVLIAEDGAGELHTLYAFSGQLGESGFRCEGFVEPVFDYLAPDGYFKRREREISAQNVEISRFEEETLGKVERHYRLAEETLNAELAHYKEQFRLSKLEREKRRGAGNIGEEELASMTRQSQFEKAELRRIKKRINDALEPLATELEATRRELDAMKEKRRCDSEALQKWLFDNFQVLNARGEKRSLSEIFSTTAIGIPPSGAGECCAPKLLQAAYLRGLTPISMAEYWYGRPKGGEVRLHGEHYPACRGKCLPVLGWMLQGLKIEPPLESEIASTVVSTPEIIFENEWFCIVNKPSGMLSVPGKGRALSVQEWLTEKYGPEKQVKMAHRLDQDTSGLLVATFGPRSFKTMQSLFATRQVKKRYVADLDGDYEVIGHPSSGRITLPISADWLDRPRQRIDFEEGKEAVTDFEFIGKENGKSRVIFYPLTGRTHQLRVHAASEKGLGMPIVGDRLYNRKVGKVMERLHLHAQKLEFIFPIDERHYSFESPLPF